MNVTTNATMERDLRASLRLGNIQRVTNAIRDIDATDDRTRATYAAKLAVNSLDPDAFDAAIVKAAELLHQELGGTQPLRDCPLYERSFALTLAMKVVSEALNVFKEVTPQAEVAQAVADLSAHRAHLTEYGKRIVLFRGGDVDGNR